MDHSSLVHAWFLTTFSSFEYELFPADTYSKLNYTSLVFLRHDTKIIMDLKIVRNSCGFLFLQTYLIYPCDACFQRPRHE